MSESRVLLADDEESFRQIVGRELRRAGYHVDEAGSVEEARHALAQQSYHVVLLDVRLPDGSGLDLLQDIKQSLPATQVVILTAFGTVQEAIRAMKHGAFDFLAKPCKLGEIEAVIEKALEVQSLERGHAVLQRDLERLAPSERIVGETAGIREVHRLIERVAQTDSTVLIRGESGSGKELVARAVHRQSRRSRQPFVVVDCAALHENLLQSELFGHEKGAYTGAVSLKHGLFEVADRGTIFLDEIGEITPPLQVKLLRVLETGTFRRLGGTADIRVDVRVIAATNRPLETMMKEGQFREDLYYRLNVFTIHIPTLRERREDIPLLIEHFVRHSTVPGAASARLSPEANDALLRYQWPGNVRELKNVIEHALILCDGGTVTREHLPLGMRTAEAAAVPEPSSSSLLTLEEAERNHIRRVLEECGGHRQKAALILGISERTLYRKLQEHGQAQDV